MHFTRIIVEDVPAHFVDNNVAGEDATVNAHLIQTGGTSEFVDLYNRTYSADCFFCGAAGTATAKVIRQTTDGHTLADYACSLCKAHWEKGKELLEENLRKDRGYVEITQHSMFNPEGYYEGLESPNRSYGKVISLSDRDIYDKEYERKLYEQEIEALSN